MEIDSCGNDNFYDEIAPFISQPGDISLDDIDEILRSTDSQLDSSIDFSTLVPYPHNDFDISMQDVAPAPQFSFAAFPSPATTNQSCGNTPPRDSKRTSSTSSLDAELFNPDEFINFLNDDDVKFESSQRNTPSPAGSYTSSSGSSTSGVQSDVSSVGSMSQTYNNHQTDLHMDVEKAAPETELEPPDVVIKSEEPFLVPAPPAPQVLPLTVPLHPLSTTMATTAPAGTIFQPINVLHGTLIPVKTVPASTVSAVSALKTPVPLRHEPKLAPKTKDHPVKVVPQPAAAVKKLTPPSNTKPKTVFLSSNDFKALMQKMNATGGVVKGPGGTIAGATVGPKHMPKIIMKTAGGKVITANANKILQPVTTTSGVAHFPSAKVLKANGPLIIKQQGGTKLISTAGGGSTKTRPAGSDPLSIYKGIIDEKILKKQERMIKNRKSASLSRKKKKEYVVSLETRINNLEKENYTLKGENTSLRSQLVAFAQTCHCKHSNVSDFILNSLNANHKIQNGGGSEHHHVRIAPKPTQKSIKNRITTQNIKKNIAILLAMTLMVTLNMGNFQNYLNRNSIESAGELVDEVPAVGTNGRRLLWVDTEREFNDKLNSSKRDTEMEVPPLHFLRPINRTSGNGLVGTVATAKTIRESTAKYAGGNNQTENLRLASNLHKWIDGNGFFNLSMHKDFYNKLETSRHFKLAEDYVRLEPEFDLPLQGALPSGSVKRKFLFESSPQDDDEEESANMAEEMKKRKLEPGMENSLDIFKPKISDEYLRLFKGIKRQDDTFYVLSFNMNHILLPASAYNKSSRPKMSLMLPAGDPTRDGDIVLMQIDCEVVNTTEVELKGHMIPEKLRPAKFSNASDVANNETKSFEKREKTLVKTEETMKERPPLRTYFMLGPKTKAAAAAAAAAAKKKETTLVKLNDSASRSPGDGSTGQTSVLFHKMRETVGGDFGPVN